MHDVFYAVLTSIVWRKIHEVITTGQYTDVYFGNYPISMWYMEIMPCSINSFIK